MNFAGRYEGSKRIPGMDLDVMVSALVYSDHLFT